MNIIGVDVSKSKLGCALIDNSTHRKLKFKVVSNSVEGFVTLNCPEFCRHIQSLQCNSNGGVYEWETV
jgi:hypothetical protein